MRLQKLVLGALVATTASMPGSAQTAAKAPNVRTLTLQECIQLALQHNLALQISRIDPQRSFYNLEGSYEVYDPTLTGAYNYQNRTSPSGVIPGSSVPLPASKSKTDDFSLGLGGTIPLDTGLQYDLAGGASYQRPLSGAEYSADVGVSLSQPLLRNFRIDSSRLSILVAKKDLKISELSLARDVMTVVTDVEKVYYELIAAEESVKVQEKALQLAEKLYEENRKRVEVGALAPLDEKQALSRVASSKADLLSAQQTLATSENVLKKLISDDYVSWHSVDVRPAERLTSDPVMLNIEDSWKRGLSMRPDFLSAKQAVERQDIVVRYQKNQLYPSLNLIGGYSLRGRNTGYTEAFDDVGDRDNPTYTLGVVLSMPLSNRGPRNRYRASQATYDQQMLSLKNQEQTILVTIDDSIKRVQSSFERVGSTREARVYSEAALDAEQKKLENGKSTSFNVLQLQRDLTDARSQEIR
ncbi:MAG: TolC family protein, partial [Opitutaceae bacterium]|nr:TolC family protein [Verrucomicrobiales bacterium]